MDKEAKLHKTKHHMKKKTQVWHSSAQHDQHSIHDQLFCFHINTILVYMGYVTDSQQKNKEGKKLNTLGWMTMICMQKMNYCYPPQCQFLWPRSPMHKVTDEDVKHKQNSNLTTITAPWSFEITIDQHLVVACFLMHLSHQLDASQEQHNPALLLLLTQLLHDHFLWVALRQIQKAHPDLPNRTGTRELNNNPITFQRQSSDPTIPLTTGKNEPITRITVIEMLYLLDHL